MFEKSIEILRKIEENGFEAYLVGGCVRDLLMAKEPKDFDITTNALPDDVLKIFDDARYENDFGTVLLPIRDENGKAISVIEITTYRKIGRASCRERV